MNRANLQKASDIFYLLSKRVKIGQLFMDGVQQEFLVLSKEANITEKFLVKQIQLTLKALNESVRYGYLNAISFETGKLEALLWTLNKLKKGESECTK